MKESDLYLPLKHYLEGQGYEVKGEVHHCDVVAVRADESPVVVELKLSFNLSILLQVVERLSLTPTVYIGIPLDTTILRTRRKHVLKLVKMLGLGLIVIDPKAGSVNTLLDPQEYKPRVVKRKQQRLLGEFSARVGDPNTGGQAMKKGLMTAYRQKALNIGDYLLQHGASQPKVIAAAIAEPKSRDILYRNVYGWFESVSRGVYDVSPRGKEEIPVWLEQRHKPAKLDGTT
ncbi:DUF2161 domain-containing phosphodiesterase [Leucothrix pacifica]|nr:DUF2161 family putative PD-(D/E)XK-type phosphodiesterase [Leucothrix pacifica]